MDVRKDGADHRCCAAIRVELDLSRQRLDEMRHATMRRSRSSAKVLRFDVFPIEIQGLMVLNTWFTPREGAPAALRG